MEIGQEWVMKIVKNLPKNGRKRLLESQPIIDTKF